MEDTIFVQNAHIDLKEAAKLENIDKLKEMNIFSENADAANQAVWDAVTEFKKKDAGPKKVEVKTGK